uniref:Aminotransferase class I/classII large domain-containing protein n=1 Tax=Neobodo designis TaxID=312471 RepID=A0A7S1QPV8_NEODS|mmetsp:Transcript_50095/g.154786  ORF Transcript_50095/g.154786 Transcript_50095/m.154786 type:complete len:505 (+) Transcript_50095:56-1570(+)
MLRASAVRRNLAVATMSKRALAAEYAVRGKIAIRANEIEAELAKGGDAAKQFGFSSLIKLNTGNPQNHEQKPWTFPHQVCALLEAPELLENGTAAQVFPADVVERAKYVQKQTAGQLGGYTATKGFGFIRKAIAEFIEKRDNASVGSTLRSVDPEDIFLSNGASGSVTPLLTGLVDSAKDGVMIPIPQYPLYTAQLALLGGTVVPYYLDEAKAWAFTVDELEQAYAKAKDSGVTPHAFVLINPGNPTGQVLDRSVLEQIVDWAHKRQLLIISDEVYQENIYAAGKKFHSMREIVLGMGEPYAKEVQLFSFHSASKGIHGECGRRGGYLELLNFPADVFQAFVKLPSINLCPNIMGQLMMDMIVKPPAPGQPSYESYRKEYDTLFAGLKRRAKTLPEQLRKVPGITCNDIEGAMYAFPRIRLPQRYIDEAKAKGKAPDAVWCMGLVEQEGVVTIPGSGFGQVEGTYHFRTTILPPDEDMQDVARRIDAYQRRIIMKYGPVADSKL